MLARRRASSRASSRPKNALSVGTPAAIAAAAGAGAGSMPEHRDAVGDEVAQQVAVVARDLDHQRAGAEAEPRDQLHALRARMRQQRARDRREVRVVAAEQHLGRDRLGDLHEAAGRAQHQVERRRDVAVRRARPRSAAGRRAASRPSDRIGASVAAAAGAAGGLGAVVMTPQRPGRGVRPPRRRAARAQRRSASIRPSRQQLAG